jgi:hypothetical protein
MQYFIFSSLRNRIRYFIQEEVLLGCADFHSNRILLRARRVQKGITFLILFVVDIPSPGTPNIAISALG